MAAIATSNPRPAQLELCLWETVVTTQGPGKAMVARRPVQRRLSVSETIAALEPALGKVDRHLVYELIRDGRLDAVQPTAVLRPLTRSDGRPRNCAHRICPESVARLLQSFA